MKRLLSVLLVLSCAVPAFAAGNEKEVNRVKDSGVVLKEILDIPDDIPRDIHTINFFFITGGEGRNCATQNQQDRQKSFHLFILLRGCMCAASFYSALRT